MIDILSKLLEIPKLALLFGGTFAISISGADQLPFIESKVPLQSFQKGFLILIGIASVSMSLWWYFSEIRDDKKSKEKSNQIKELETAYKNVLKERDVAINGQQEAESLLSKIKKHPGIQQNWEITQLISSFSPSNRGDISSSADALTKAVRWLESKIPDENCKLIADIDKESYQDLVRPEKMHEFRLEIYQHMVLLKKNITEMRSGRSPAAAGILQNSALNPLAYEKAITGIQDTLLRELEQDPLMAGESGNQLKLYFERFVGKINKKKT